jgi:uracil-DNA glycosylase family 4
MNLPQFPSYPECTRCELHEEARNPGVPTIHYDQSVFPSPVQPFLIVVGMNPGINEDRANIPFVGPTGKMLKDIYLKSMNILDRYTVYLSNAVRCCTPGNTNLKNSHITKCFHHTKDDIQTICDWHDSQGYILCLGSHAVHAVTKNYFGKSLSLAKSLDKQGQAIKEGLNFFATYHPAGVMRAPKLKFAVAEHLEVISQQMTGATPTPSFPNIIEPRAPFHART